MLIRTQVKSLQRNLHIGYYTQLGRRWNRYREFLYWKHSPIKTQINVFGIKKAASGRGGEFAVRFAWNGTKSRLEGGKYDVCSNQHFSTTICAIISLRVCIDINCARTFHLKKQNFILSVSHNFTHILISFFFGQKCQKTLFFTTTNFNFFEKILPHISRRYFFKNKRL